MCHYFGHIKAQAILETHVEQRRQEREVFPGKCIDCSVTVHGARTKHVCTRCIYMQSGLV